MAQAEREGSRKIRQRSQGDTNCGETGGYWVEISGANAPGNLPPILEPEQLVQNTTNGLFQFKAKMVIAPEDLALGVRQTGASWHVQDPTGLESGMTGILN